MIIIEKNAYIAKRGNYFRVEGMYPRTPILRRLPRIVTVPKGYVTITRKGIEFVRKRYSCSVTIDSGEIKLYEFLIRLLSFDGILPLALIRRWRETEILKKAQENHLAHVTAFGRGLPEKKEIQAIVDEIWGKIPKNIYV